MGKKKSRHWKSHFGKFGPTSLGRLDVLVERNIACQAMEFLTAPWKRSSAKFSTQNVFFKALPISSGFILVS